MMRVVQESPVVPADDPEPQRSWIGGAGGALLVTAAAAGGRAALQPILGFKLPYITFFAAAMFSAHLGGVAAGVLSILIGGTCALAWFIPPHGPGWLPATDDVLGLALYVVLALAIVLAMAAQRRASARAVAATASAERSERRTRDVLESISDSFYALDREWRITHVNQQAGRYFQRPVEELVGRKFWELMPQKIGTVFEQCFTQALDDRTPVRFEALSPVTHQWIDVHVYPTDTGLSVFYRDMADRLARERGEVRVAAILRSATDAIITVDEAEHITVFSAGAEHIFGCSAADAIGQRIDRFIPARFRAAHHGHIRAFGETAVGTRPMGGERVLMAMRANGEEFPMEASISQSTVGGEKLYTVILRDVTERVRAQRERDTLLAQARSAAMEAEQANRAKDEFLATLSHELRTPLTPILSWATLMRTRPLDAATTHKALETIERSARSQARLIEDLLDISRIAAGKLHLEMRPIRLGALIEPAVESLRPAADAKRIRIHARLEGDGCMVAGDPERLQQVAWNLLSNAVKFTPDGGSVEVTVRQVDARAELVVADTGQGIAPDFLPHVFERFRQHDATTTRAHGGLGIGLAIVRHLVELHGGTVGCESPGRNLGAIFTVSFPLLSRDGDRASPPGSEHAPDPAAARLDGLRILIVDDERETLDAIATVLAGAGAEVRTAATADAALAAVAASPPDVLVCDIGLPDQDGYALIRKVRALERERGWRIVAVALTAYSRVEDRVAALESGFQRHIAKPVEPADLVTAIAAVATVTESRAPK